jgi:phosphatidylinositol alpha-1,6-mannosyltransferase
MNLAMITQDFPPEVGGIETYAAELADRFAKHCNEFIILAPDKPEARTVDRRLSYPVYRIASGNSFMGLASIPEVPRLLEQKGISNIFHTQWQTLPAAVFAKKLGTVQKIFVAAHARELLFNPFQSIPVIGQQFETYKKWLLSKADYFFPVSSYTASLLSNQEIDETNIRTVINGTDPKQFYPTDKRAARRSIGANDQNIMLTITRLVSRKGIDTALRAFSRVKQKQPDSLYFVVGEGPQREEFQMLARQLGIADSVRFTGRVPFESLLDYYNACDVFVMPSKTELPNVEGFGIVFLEAGACGKPVIGTFSGGIPSAIVNGETGFLVSEGDFEELSKALERLFVDKELAKKMGNKGREHVQNEANWDKTAQKLLQSMQDKI